MTARENVASLNRRLFRQARDNVASLNLGLFRTARNNVTSLNLGLLGYKWNKTKVRGQTPKSFANTANKKQSQSFFSTLSFPIATPFLVDVLERLFFPNVNTLAYYLQVFAFSVTQPEGAFFKCQHAWKPPRLMYTYCRDHVGVGNVSVGWFGTKM